MIVETLRSIIMASKDALQTTCGLSVTGEHISQIKQGELTFPSIGELAISGSAVQEVHLGCDNLLVGHLAQLVDEVNYETGVSVLAQHIVSQLVSELEGRNSTGQIKKLEIGPVALQTRGMRSFGFRLETSVGQFYLTTEVPNRVEMEHAKGSEFVTRLINSYMKKGWVLAETITSGREIDNFLILMRKAECDAELFVKNGEGGDSVHHGFILEQCLVDGERALKISSDLAEPGGGILRIGEDVKASVGLQDRSIEFTCKYLGRSEHAVVGSAKLHCMMFSVPEVLNIQQRRKAFRIEVPTEITVEFRNITSKDSPGPAQVSEILSPIVLARIEDLSFSGARIVGDWKHLPGCFQQENQIRCRMFFPDQPNPISLDAIIRRASTNLEDRDSWLHNLGIEFVISPDMDMTSLYHIREYVLSVQRAKLAQRVSVAGVDQW